MFFSAENRYSMGWYCKAIGCVLLATWLDVVMPTTGSAAIDCQTVNDKPDDVPVRYCALRLIAVQQCLCQTNSWSTKFKKSLSIVETIYRFTTELSSVVFAVIISVEK